MHAARARLSQHKPQLIPAFDRLVADVSPILGLSTDTVESALYLTLAGEYLYIDAAALSRAMEKREFRVFAGVLYRLTKADYNVAASFLRLYPTLPYQLAEIGEPLGALVETAAKKNARFACALKLCLSRSDPREAAAGLRSFSVVVSAAPAVITEVCRVAETYLRRRHWDRLEAWLRRGVDLIESGRAEAGVDHLRLMSPQSRELLGFRFVALTDVRGVLSIYASSLCGRRLTVNDCSSSPFLLRTPHIDGQALLLPARLQCSPILEENRRAYTAMAALQAATIAYGTFMFDLRQLEVLDHLREHYGTVLADEMEHLRKLFANRAKTVRERTSGDVEAVFDDDRVLPLLETYHEEFFFRFPTPDLARELFQLLELARLQRKLALRYPGLSEDFAIIDTWIDGKPSSLVPANESYDELITVLRELQRRLGLPGSHSGSQDSRDLTSREERRLQEMARATAAVHDPDASVYHTAEATFSLYNLLYEQYELVPFCRQHDVRRIFAVREKFSLHPEIVLDKSPYLMVLRPERDEVISNDADGEQEIDLTSFGAVERESQRVRRALVSGAYSIHRYPEYDHGLGGYRHDHCTVYESPLASSDPGYYLRTLKTHALVHKRVKKRFLALQPEEVSITRKWEDGGDIHIGDATDYATSLLMGRTVDEKVYMRKVTNKRDVTVAVLLDASSSTAEPIAGATIIDLERGALSVLASALSTIGDHFAMFTYFSMGRSNVFVNVVKGFAEPWNRESQGRIAAIEAHAANRDGAAIRHVAGKLREEPGKTKLLILLSDGIPADPGYGATSGVETNRYALEDTRRALMETKREGMTPFCVTIDRFARSYIPYLYGSYHYTVLDDIALLPERLSRVYLRLTR